MCETVLPGMHLGAFTAFLEFPRVANLTEAISLPGVVVVGRGGGVVGAIDSTHARYFAHE